MPRIRTIKPEFWDSPGTARASLRARLFYIAMWNWADDYGIGTASPRQLLSFAFPNDLDVTDAEFPCLRTEVADAYDVVFYEVDGRPYYAIPSWDKHQKNERRAQGRYPGPDKAERFMHGTSAQAHGSSGTGTGEQGNRGTGEQGKSVTHVGPVGDDAQKRDATPRGTRLDPDFIPSEKSRTAIIAKYPALDLLAEHEKFTDYWTAVAGAKGVKLDWDATWRNWMRKAGDETGRRPKTRQQETDALFDAAARRMGVTE